MKPYELRWFRAPQTLFRDPGTSSNRLGFMSFIYAPANCIFFIVHVTDEGKAMLFTPFGILWSWEKTVERRSNIL